VKFEYELLAQPSIRARLILAMITKLLQTIGPHIAGRFAVVGV
jgi:hypothetical protein